MPNGYPTPEDLERLKAGLNARELQAYELCVKRNQMAVSDIASDSFYQMYLAGASCQDIQKSNTGFTLGQIVRCRLEGDWDNLRAEYQARLYTGVADAVKQAQMESVKFLALRLTASHKFHTDRLLKFIQSGDEKLVEGLGVDNFKQYQETLDTLMKATGQNAQRIAISGSVEHSLSEAVRGILDPARAPTPQEAELVIKGLLEGNKDENDPK